MKSPRAEDVRRCISALWDTLQCPICLELMTTPVSTKCEHQFCKFCMQKLLDGNKRTETKCPVCKTRITKRSLQDSPGFMRLITGLRNMIEAYEKDTGTNYITGMAQHRRLQSRREAGSSIVLSGDASDNGDSEEHGLPCSHSSTIEAQNGFASLMDLEDSNILMVINDCLDTSCSETPQTSGEKIHTQVGISPTVGPVYNQEMAEVVEKATTRPRTRGTKRIAQREILSSRISLVPEEDQQQQAQKEYAKKETENPEKIQRQKKKSVEKVSEWLLQVPRADNLDSEVAPDPTSYPECPSASPTGSFSSDCTKIISRVEPEANRKTEEQVRSLEDQVFGFVYTRRGKRSFSPPQRHLKLLSHEPSLLSEEHNPNAHTGQSSLPVPDDYAKTFNSEADVRGGDNAVKIQLQPTNKQSSDATKDVSVQPRALDLSADVNEEKHRELSEEPTPQEGDTQKEEGEVSSLAIQNAVLQLETISTNRTRPVMQDIDVDLKKQTTEKQKTDAKKKPWGRKGKKANLQKAKSARWPNPVVIVSSLIGEYISETPQSRLEFQHVEIESNPNRVDVGATVTRSTRSKGLHFAKDVLESPAGKPLKNTAISLRESMAKESRSDNQSLAKPFEEAKNIGSHFVNQPMLNANKGNGCICDEDIGGIELIESVEASINHLRTNEVVPQINGSIVEVPNSVSPCEMGTACFMPAAQTCRSPTEAAEPRPNAEIKSATKNNAHIVESTTVLDCVGMEERGDLSESDIDTEQLMKSFRVAKRKSFHLCSPIGRRSIVSSDKDHQNSKTEDDFGSVPELITNQISTSIAESATLGSERLPEIEKASCGNGVASSNSPSHTSLSGVRPRRGLRRRHDQSEEVLKLDGTPSTKSQDCVVDCLSKNPVYSALSPNKAARSPSLHRTVTPDNSESVMLFSALEVAEDGSIGMTSRSSKRLLLANKSQQPTKINLEEITRPKTRLDISTDMSAKQGNTDNSMEVMLNTDVSVTPEGLVPSVEESADIAPPSSNSPSASYPIKKIPMRKRKSQRLESSSDSSEEELPSLMQIFKSHLPATKCNPVEGQLVTHEGPGVVSGFKELGLSAAPQASLPVCPPSQDSDELSQASVDLFDTPAECEMAAIDNGVFLDSSQFSSELLVTQQKQAMQKELLRLGNLMALVTEVLQEKEEQPGEQPSTDRELSVPCDQEVKQISSDPGPIQTQPSPVKPRKTPEPVRQSSMALRHRTGLSGEPRTPGSQGSKGNSTVGNTTPQPPPPVLETSSRDQVTRGTPVTTSSYAAVEKPECVFASSGLRSDEQVVVKKFAKRIGARVVPQVTPEVTHVIMRTDDDLVCERTLKYFLGIAGRKWVVSFLWISECFKQGKLLDETVFEVRGDVVNGADHQGPLRARCSGEQELLMKDYKICFQGSFTDMTKDQMEWMVELCGAAVVKDPLQFSSEKRAHQLVIVQPGMEPALTKPSALSRRATVVNRGWLLDSVATYTLQNQGDYRA